MMASGGTPYNWDDFCRTLRNQFGQAVSPGTLLLVFGSIVGIVLLLYGLSKLQEALRRPAAPNDATRLYRLLLQRIGLPRAARRLLLQMAEELKLPHPSVLLLSETAYDRTAEQWRKRRSSAGNFKERQAQDRSILQARQALFPRSDKPSN